MAINADTPGAALQALRPRGSWCGARPAGVEPATLWSDAGRLAARWAAKTPRQRPPEKEEQSGQCVFCKATAQRDHRPNFEHASNGCSAQRTQTREVFVRPHSPKPTKSNARRPGASQRLYRCEVPSSSCLYGKSCFFNTFLPRAQEGGLLWGRLYTRQVETQTVAGPNAGGRPKMQGTRWGWSGIGFNSSGRPQKVGGRQGAARNRERGSFAQIRPDMATPGSELDKLTCTRRRRSQRSRR